MQVGTETCGTGKVLARAAVGFARLVHRVCGEGLDVLRAGLAAIRETGRRIPPISLRVQDKPTSLRRAMAEARWAGDSSARCRFSSISNSSACIEPVNHTAHADKPHDARARARPRLIYGSSNL